MIEEALRRLLEDVRYLATSEAREALGEIHQDIILKDLADVARLVYDSSAGDNAEAGALLTQIEELVRS